MKIVIDMNLSPEWVGVFEAAGYRAVHWSDVGNIKASDSTIMSWAASNGYIVFTHDLDFGTLLAISAAVSPKRYPNQDSRCFAKQTKQNGFKCDQTVPSRIRNRGINNN